MSLKELSEKVAGYLAKFTAQKFTGRLTFTFDFRDGGIGNCGVDILQRDKDPFNEGG